MGHHCVSGGGDAEATETVGMAFCGVETGGDEDLVLKGGEEGGAYEVRVKFCGDGHDEIVECG